MASNVFSIRDLSFSYGAKRVFDGLSLDIPEGKVTTLIGANGSGKTTLFNLMTKNLKPQRGSVYLRQGNVADLRLRDFSRLVAIVHQHNTAPTDLSVEKLVAYGRFPHGRAGLGGSAAENERMVSWALRTTGLSDFAQQPVSSLSGGQAQRAWIAMALAQGTEVLLLDEPTTFLDVRYQLDILRLVRSLNADTGMTVVMVLHDMNPAIHYSDHLVALAEGNVASQGGPARIVTPELLLRVYGIPLEVIDVKGLPFVLQV